MSNFVILQFDRIVTCLWMYKHAAWSTKQLSIDRAIPDAHPSGEFGRIVTNCPMPLLLGELQFTLCKN